MRTIRKFVASLSLAALVASFALIAPVQAATFSDVPSDHWAYDAVEYLAGKGVVDKKTNYEVTRRAP